MNPVQCPVTSAALFALGVAVLPAHGQLFEIPGSVADHTLRANIDFNGNLAGPNPITILAGSQDNIDLDITSDPASDLAARRAVFMFDLSPLLGGGAVVDAATLRVNLVDVDLTSSIPTDFYISNNLRPAPSVDIAEWDEPSYTIVATDVFDGSFQDQPPQNYFMDVTSEISALRADLLLDPSAPFVHFRGQAGSNGLLFMEISSANAAADVVPLLSVRLVPEPTLLGFAGLGMLLLKRRR